MTDVVDNEEKKESKYIYAVYPKRTKDTDNNKKLSDAFTNAVRCTEGAFNKMVTMTDRDGNNIISTDKDGKQRFDKKGNVRYVSRLVTFIPKDLLATAHPDLKVGQLFTNFKDVWKKREDRTSDLSEEVLNSIGKNYDAERGKEIAAEKKVKAAEHYKQLHENDKVNKATDELTQTETQGRSR